MAGKAKTPLEMRGQLVWEHDDINNMGFAVKPAKGQARAFVYDMSIGGGVHDIIRTLIERESATQFLVRGMTTDEGGFDDGQCRDGLPPASDPALAGSIRATADRAPSAASRRAAVRYPSADSRES